MAQKKDKLSKPDAWKEIKRLKLDEVHGLTYNRTSITKMRKILDEYKEKHPDVEEEKNEEPQQDAPEKDKGEEEGQDAESDEKPPKEPAKAPPKVAPVVQRGAVPDFNFKNLRDLMTFAYSKHKPTDTIGPKFQAFTVEVKDLTELYRFGSVSYYTLSMFVNTMHKKR